MRQFIDLIESPHGDNTPAHAFLADLRDATGENWFNGKERVLGQAATQVTLVSPSEVHINDIRSMSPGEGHASKLLKLVTTLADKHQITLDLTAKSYDDERMSTQKLISWYMRNGFERGDYDAYEEDDGVEMVRKPLSPNRGVIKLGSKMRRPD